MSRVPRLRAITPAQVNSIERYGPGGMPHISRASGEIRVGWHRGIQHSSRLIFENPLKGIQPEDESVLSTRLYVRCLHTHMHTGATVRIGTVPSSGLEAVVYLNTGLLIAVPLLWNNRLEDAMRIDIALNNASSAEYCKLGLDTRFEIGTLCTQTP